MKELMVGVQNVVGNGGEVFRISYYRLEDNHSYGICVRNQLGEAAIFVDVTRDRRRINALLRAMMRGGVTPMAAQDVVTDWLIR